MQWSFGIEHQFGNTGNVRAQYVGTRAVNQPYLTQVNGYQTVCQGCFAPFPYLQPADPRFGAVTQFSTGANSHYNGLQLTADEATRPRLARPNQLHLQPLHGRSFQRRLSAVFRGRECSRPCRESLRAIMARAITTSATISPREYVYRAADQSAQPPPGICAERMAGFGNGRFGTAGIPFSVLSTPYSANGNGIVQGGGPQFASVVPGVPLY